MHVKIEAISGEISLKRKAPKYTKSNIRTEVKRASQTQKVPHIGLPQKQPVNKVSRVHKMPIFAPVCENKFNIGCLVSKKRKLVKLISKYIIILIQAAGTCTKIIR